MMLRRWLAVGLFCWAGSLYADPKPADLPMKTGVDGKVPTPLMLEHYQPDPVPARMPASMFERMPPSKNAPVAGSFGAALITLNATIIPVAGQQFAPDTIRDAKATLEQAESHYKACNADEAKRLYREVVRLAPQSPYAALAGERLLRVALTEQSAEPPLATKAPSESVPDVSELKLKVLWEAARQYKAAVERGERDQIEKSGKVLEAALQATREPAKTR